MRSTKKSSLDANAHIALFNAKRFDVFRTARGNGFILVMNRDTALFFYKEGDHFKYDGSESGPYAQGNINIFDNAPIRSPYP